MQPKQEWQLQHFLRSPLLIWLIVWILGSWLLVEYGMVLLAPTLGLAERWLAALSMIALMISSLIGHIWAHKVTSRSYSSNQQAIPLNLFGDPAQVWPAQEATCIELYSVLAGPAFNVLLAIISAIIWNMQLDRVLDTISFGLALFNAAITLVNLMPAYPLDGGRLLCTLLQGWLPIAQARRIVSITSIVLFGGLLAWGIYLISLQARFSLETGAGLIAATLLLASGLRYRPEQMQEQTSSRNAKQLSEEHFKAGCSHTISSLSGVFQAAKWPGRHQKEMPWRDAVPPNHSFQTASNNSEALAKKRFSIVASMLILILQLGIALALLPMVDGMYAPGPAVAVGPMISVPAERRSEETHGALLLTTVITQTPITLGQWLWAQLNPAYVLVPPERVVPVDMTPQQLIQRNVSMLEESEATALVVGARLGGYPAELTSTALQISSVAADSPSLNILLPGDIILSVDNTPTPDMTSLREQLARHRAGDQVTLQLERQGERKALTVELMAPAENSQIPRIGIALQPLGLNAELPFPISITTQKIVGGPSAGLMFSLAIYDALSAGDLTQGWRIAGTGTISLDGTVGPIGGIAQKVAGAEWAGAEFFIVPREHEQEARQVARRIQLIPVSTAQEAIQALQKLPPHP